MRATVKAAAAPSRALDLCGCPQRALLATRRQHGVQVQKQLCDALFTHDTRAADGLDAADHLLCEGAESARELVTEFLGGATPHRSGVAQS